MHKLTAILATLALSSSASAAPRKAHHAHHAHHARRAPSPAKIASQQWVRDCVHERTGPTGGLSVTVATRLCRALSRVHDAIEVCEQAVVDACVEQDGAASCEDDALAVESTATCYPQPDRAREAK